MEKSKKETILGLIAIFVIFLIVNTTAVHAIYMTNPKPLVIVENNTAEIKWATNVNSTGTVNYGSPEDNLTKSASSTILSTLHSVLITDLLYAHTYYFTITMTNGTETQVVGGASPYSFFTRNPPQPPTGGETEGDELEGDGETKLTVDISEFTNKQMMPFKGNSSDNVKYLMSYVNPSEDVIYGRGGNAVFLKSDGSFYGQVFLDVAKPNNVVLWAGDSAHNDLLIRNYNVTVDNKPPTIEFTMPNGSATPEMELGAKVDEPVYVTYYVSNALNESDALNVTVLHEPDSEGMIHFNVLLSEEHTNFVVIKIVDRAGNGEEWNALIDVMAEPPKIHSHNLGALTPSYAQSVVVKGNVTPNTIVVIRVNGKESPKGAFSTSFIDVITNADHYIEQERYMAKVGEDGLFEIEIMLTQELYETSTYETDTFQEEYQQPPPHFPEQDDVPMVGGDEYGIASSFDNNIEIIVLDKLGRNATESQVITFAKCGFGSDWNIEISDVVPSAITPALLREGLAQVSFSAKYDWQGPGNKPLIMGPPTVTVYDLSEEDREKYAVDPLQIVKMPVRPTSSADYKKVGYVVEFNKFEKPIEYWHNLTEKGYEEYLIKVPIRTEIRYHYTDVFGNQVEKIQRQCFEDFTVFVDIQIPPDTIPTELLKGSITVLNKTIEVIDLILEPLKTVTLWVFIGCLISWVFLFFKYLGQWIECSGDKHYMDGESGCKGAVDRRWEFEQKMSWLCDRSFCPSAPAYNKYVLDQQEQWGGADKAKEIAVIDNIPPQCHSGAPDVRDAKKEEGCGKEYYETWNSACVLMNELDRSKCIEHPEHPDCGGAQKIWYAVSGFCEKQGDPKEVVVKRGNVWYGYDPNDAQAKGSKWCVGNENSFSERLEKDANKPGVYTKVSEDFICSGTYLSEQEAIDKDLIKGGKKDYVVDPTSGFLTSLQCVCLPAIVGYLQLIRNVLNAIMQCFQSILITGEGKSGLCRAVLTVYICDLLFDAIRCFVNRMAGGSGSKNKGGIQGMMQNIADAGDSTRKSIVNRYGKTALYRSMFDERKLVHAICLFAFTGDFDFDIMGALTGAGAVPLNSEAFIHPATRRFLGSDPISGYATWVYHLGVGIVAGADLRYKVNLICSTGDTCSSEDGFPSNRCDCFGMPNEIVYPVTAHVGGGNIKAGTFLGGQGPEGDVYVKIERTKYRFDTAEIWYEWKNNMGEKVHDSTRRAIRRIGDEPPVECSFDMMAAAFMCQYHIGDLGSTEFTRKPMPIKDRFYLNEDIVLDFHIIKAAPSDREIDQPIPSILVYRIRDHKGNLLKFEDGRTEKQKMLVEDRAFFSADLGNLPFYRVTLDDFGGVGPETDVDCTSEAGGLDVKGSGVCTKGKLSSATHGKAVRFMASDDGEKVYCSVHDLKGDNNEIQDKGRAIDETNDKVAVDEGTGPTNRFTCYGGVTVQVGKVEPKKSYFVKVILKATAAETEAGDVGCLDYTQTAPATWKVDMELHCCHSSSNDTQPTFDNCEASPDVIYSRGQPQAYTGQTAIPIKVVCGESSEAELRTCSDAGLVNRLLDKDCLCEGIVTGPDKDSNYCLYKDMGDGVFKEDRTTYTACTLKNALMSSPDLFCDCDGDKFMECGTGRMCELVDKAADTYKCSESKCTPDDEKETCGQACQNGGVCKYGKCQCNEDVTTTGKQTCINKGYNVDIGDKYMHMCLSKTTARGCDTNTGDPKYEYDISDVQNPEHRQKLEQECGGGSVKCEAQEFTFSFTPSDGFLYQCMGSTKVKGCKLSTGSITEELDISSFSNPSHKAELEEKCKSADSAAQDSLCQIPEGKKVAFVGDSITNWGKSGSRGYQKYFYDKCPTKKARGEFETFAKTGERTNGILNNIIPKAINWEPDYVVILAGVNDQLKTTAARTKAITNLRRMYGVIHETRPNAKVIAVTILPWEGYDSWNDDAGTGTIWVNQRILSMPTTESGAIAAGYNKNEYVYAKVKAYSALKDPANPTQLKPEYDQTPRNFLHPGQKGYDKLGETIYDNVVWT